MLSYGRGRNMAFDQKEYVNDYNKATYKLFPFRVRKDNFDILDKLSSVNSINGYINSLIENDIHKEVLTLKQIKEKILPILAKHNIYEVYLFGSYARGEANSKSDVDVYCEPGDIKSFIDQGFLEDELKEALHKDIDIVFNDARLDEFFKEQLDKDKIKLC